MGPMVTSQTPLVPLVISTPWPLPGISPAESFTVSALGARMRKVMWWSEATSGEVTCGPCGPRPRPEAGAGAAAGAGAGVGWGNDEGVRARGTRRAAKQGFCFIGWLLAEGGLSWD